MAKALLMAIVSAMMEFVRCEVIDQDRAVFCTPDSYPRLVSTPLSLHVHALILLRVVHFCFHSSISSCHFRTCNSRTPCPAPRACQTSPR